MLINEQKYTNKNRLYYRELRNNSQKGFQEIYLTNSPIYALSYAGINGQIDIYKFKESANIFNMRCKEDEAKLRKFCQTHFNQYGDYLKLFDKLKDNSRPLIIAIIA